MSQSNFIYKTLLNPLFYRSADESNNKIENTSEQGFSKLVIMFPPNPAPFMFFLKKPVDEIVVKTAKNDNPTLVYKSLGN